jgi:HK97 family phage prohead protease
MPVQAEIIHRSATLAPSTFNRQARTVDAVLSTGAGVQRRDARGTYMERLSTAPDAVTMHTPRLPILDSHRQGSVADVLGFVPAVRSENGELHATLHITSDHAAALVESGAVSGVSMGYRATQIAETEGGKVRTANKWTLMEVSLVPVPADPGATLRSQPSMEPTTTTTTEPVAPPPPAVQPRAEINTAIRALGTSLGLGTPWIDTQIDNSVDLPTARAAALDEITRRSAAGTMRVQQIGVSNDDPAVMRTRQTEALTHRCNSALPLPEEARQYAGLSLVDHARVMLMARGEAGVAVMSKEALLTRAITTGDLPDLLLATGNRVLMAAYQAAPNPLKQLAKQVTIPDFRTRYNLRLGEMSILSRVPEGAEVTVGGVGESSESYALTTYAKQFQLTRQAMINDDLGAFSGITGAMGRAATETEAQLLTALLVQNGGLGPTMTDDDNPMFCSVHGNYTNTGTVISITALDAARQAMRTQKGTDGVTPINATARYLLVAPNKETQAEQTLSTIYPVTFEDANPFVGRLTTLVEPRLTGLGWYTFADPGILPCLEYAYLADAPGPQMVARQGWEVLGMQFRVHLDFGCGAVDWRGAYYNPGA